MGGPDSSGPPLIGYDSDPPRGLTNSTNPDYPTANILDFSFSTPVSGVSFYFNNYGNNGTSYYAAFNSTGTLIETGNVSSDQGLADIVLTASGIKDLQFNNGETSSTSWYFAVPSIIFSSTSTIPEPSSWSLMALGFAGYRRTRVG
jgi:PEP-CTERM motif